MAVASFHAANEVERLAAYRNVHETWGRGAPLDDFLERRLKSPAHNRARWWVATVDGCVAASLGCHPLQFIWQGQARPGFGICAVHTVPAYRRQGLADQLCRTVIADSEASNDWFGLLFSDISPAYYARMGFRELPARSFRCQRLPELAASGPGCAVTPLEPVTLLGFLADTYNAHHRLDELYLARDLHYWRYAIERHAGSLFYRLSDAEQGDVGYAWLNPLPSGDCSLELALTISTPQVATTALRAVAQAAAGMGATALAGWLPPWSTVREWFQETTRSQQIPMILPLKASKTWPGTQPPSHHFWHTDHI
ncbi:MAG: GNAT family N-acetyltransferase [Pirellulales bacterium]